MIQSLTYSFADYRLRPAARELRRDGVALTVPTRVFDCLVYLIENRDRAIGRDELVAALWGRADVSDAQLGQVVLRARRAVGDDGNDQRCIRTMPKYGYRWMAETRVESSDPGEASGPARELHGETGEAPHAPTTASPAPERPAPRSPARASRASWKRRSAWLAGVAAVGAALAVALLHRFGGRAPHEIVKGSGFVVLPIDVTGGQGQDWIRLGGMDALAARLRAAGLRVPPTESVLAALQAGRAGGHAGEDSALRRATSAEFVVHAELAFEPQGWHVELAAQPESGQALKADAQGRDVLPTLRRAADRLLLRMGRMVPEQPGTDNDLEETLQRADAAMLANQLDIARAILTAAPELARSEPQLRYRLAMIDFRAGRLDAVESTLQSIVDSGAAGKDALLRARALTGLGTVHLNLGRFADSERDFSAAIDALADVRRPLELGQAFGGRGAARAAQWHYAEATDDLARARIELEQAGDTLGYARLDMVDGELELQRDRPGAARPMLERAVPVFARFDAVNERLHSLALLIESERLQLDYAAALATGAAALELRARATDPQLRAEVVVAYAELLIRLGRNAEAGALLAGLDGVPASLDPQLLAGIDRARAELAFATGDAAAAITHANAAIAKLSAPHATEERGRLVLLRERAQLELGKRDDARRDVSAALSAEGPAARDEIDYRVASAEIAAADGNDAEAETHFRAALALADADGIAEHMVVAATAYAGWLPSRNRAVDAQAIVGRVAVWADRDFRCALLQLDLFHRLGRTKSWAAALASAEKLAGERRIPADLRRPPPA